MTQKPCLKFYPFYFQIHRADAADDTKKGRCDPGRMQWKLVPQLIAKMVKVASHS